ncbi:hypothetical protein ACIQUC_15700 [Curtobacterium sp. NPDC098951]
MTEHHVIQLGDVITDRWGNVGIVLELKHGIGDRTPVALTNLTKSLAR